jgi:hypothetical protein
VSDDELIELLDLALSSDTTNTVRRARELMGSAIDPLQLVSQLANLIMDILSGRCQSAVSEVSKSFLGRYACACPILDMFLSYCHMHSPIVQNCMLFSFKLLELNQL